MILLDDAQSNAASPTSRLYDNTLNYWSVLPNVVISQNVVAIQNCFDEISAALTRGEFVVAAFAYELGRLFHKLSQRLNTAHSPHPLIEA
ncbi:hypothetical protein [Polynucleobacter necessarius]|uniref:hypothetical protein n=1 Tax=Polynucleobacter necessarius TaxID=576610 RepID=UPI000E097B8A|nr:hypothetical protein [Polynucleobacter necessarius]HAT40041.1 hypothetical protein [Polynucleobacter sp.]